MSPPPFSRPRVPATFAAERDRSSVSKPSAGGGAITDAEARAMTGGARLNPDWVEWLMGWPVGHTDPDRDAEADFRPLGDDPATLPRDAADYLPRVTDRREHRVARIKALGNGQVPLCAAIAFDEGLATLSRYLAG